MFGINLLKLPVKINHSSIFEEKMETYLRAKPLMLKVETSSICNAACLFCGYTHMQRKKTVMPLEVFEKVCHDYDQMGGGSLTLTPMVGDPLTDPFLMDRLQILGTKPSIDKVSFTTNLIAHKRFTDAQWLVILTNLYYLQVSTGEFDDEAYHKLYGVNKLKNVIEGLERILLLKEQNQLEVQLALAFRTKTKRLYSKEYQEFFDSIKHKVYFSHIFAYGNWAGVLNKIKHPDMPHIMKKGPASTHIPCGVMKTMLAVLSDGTVTACACIDMEGDLFPLGNIMDQPLLDIYTSLQRSKFLESSHLQPCMGCSKYKGWNEMMKENMVNLSNPNSIPVKFYNQFNGG